MIFLLALIPATGLTVAGYVALFLSQRSEGALKTFGRYLGIWAWVLAALVVLGGMFAAGHVRAHAGMWGPHPGMWGTHEGMQCPWMEGRDADRWERREPRPPGAPQPPEGAGAPAAPAAPPASR
jgi:hypothetical protein